MKPDQLRTERVSRGWGQKDLARRLHVSQSYVALLENGRRPVTPKLGRKLMNVYKLSPAVLLASEPFVPEVTGAQRLAEETALLGYPGYAYLRPHVAKKNPGEVLLTALAQKDLEPRLVEALPWVLLKYWDMDFTWVVDHAKKFDLQNRLGFVVSVARKVSENGGQNDLRTRTLMNLESNLDRSRLVREDDFPKPIQNRAERQWLLENRPDDAKHWNLVTDLQPGHLGYEGRTA
jgi:transcriptional regulator with XRE-family HTH domain